MRKTEPVVSGERMAEFWARIKTELNTKMDKQAAAAPGEVAEMLDEVFGGSGGSVPTEPPDSGIADDAEVSEMLNEVFGSGASSD